MARAPRPAPTAPSAPAAPTTKPDTSERARQLAMGQTKED